MEILSASDFVYNIFFLVMYRFQDTNEKLKNVTFQASLTFFCSFIYLTNVFSDSYVQDLVGNTVMGNYKFFYYWDISLVMQLNSIHDKLQVFYDF